MTTPLWIPLVAAGVGSVTTFIGVAVTNLATRSRFNYEKRQRHRELLRMVVADLLARGIDYASKVDTVVLTGDEHIPGLTKSKDAPDSGEAATKILDRIRDAYPLREPMFNAIYAADIAVPQSSKIRPALDRYIQAGLDLTTVVSHYTNVLARVEEYRPSRGSDAMAEFHSALEALRKSASEHIRVLD